MSVPGQKLKVFSEDDPLIKRVDAILQGGEIASVIQDSTRDALGIQDRYNLPAFEEAETQPGIGAATRAVLSLTPLAKRKQEFLKKLGFTDFELSEAGEITLAKKPGGKWQYVDKPAFTGGPKEILADAADMLGGAVEVVPGLALSMLGRGGAIKQGAKGSLGDIIGSASRAGLETLAFDGVTPSEAAYRAAANVAGGVVPNIATSAARGAWRSIPRNAFVHDAAQKMGEMRPIKKVESEILESKRLEEEIGAPLTPGQSAVSESLRGMERAASSSGELGVSMALRDVEKAQQSAMLKHWRKTLDLVHPEVGAQEAAEKAYKAGDEAIMRVVKRRKEAADEAFGEAERIAGGQPVIPTDRFKKYIEDAIERFGKPGIIGERKALYNELVAMRKKFGDGDWLMSPRQMSDVLSGLGGVAFARESLGAALQNPSTAKGVIRGAWKELMTDLSEASTSAQGPTSLAAKQLGEARAHYARMSRYVEDSSAKMLKDMFGLAENESIEFLPKRMVSGMSLEKIRKGLKVIGAGDKMAAEGLRRAALEELMLGAEKKSGWSLDTMHTVLSDPRKKKIINAIIDKSPSRRSFLDSLMFENNYLRRATFEGTVAGGHKASSGSRTAGVLQAIANRSGGGPVVAAARALNLVVSPEVQIKLMATQEGRDILLKTLREARRNGRVLPGTAAQFFAVWERDQIHSINYDPNLPDKGETQ